MKPYPSEALLWPFFPPPLSSIDASETACRPAECTVIINTGMLGKGWWGAKWRSSCSRASGHRRLVPMQRSRIAETRRRKARLACAKCHGRQRHTDRRTWLERWALLCSYLHESWPADWHHRLVASCLWQRDTENSFFITFTHVVW